MCRAQRKINRCTEELQIEDLRGHEVDHQDGLAIAAWPSTAKASAKSAGCLWPSATWPLANQRNYYNTAFAGRIGGNSRLHQAARMPEEGKLRKVNIDSQKAPRGQPE